MRDRPNASYRGRCSRLDPDTHAFGQDRTPLRGDLLMLEGYLGTLQAYIPILDLISALLGLVQR